MKRDDISGLRKNRPIFLKIGFALSLSFVILAFEWTIKESGLPFKSAPTIETEDIEVIRTRQEVKKLTIPKVELAKNIIEEQEPLLLPVEPEPVPGPTLPAPPGTPTEPVRFKDVPLPTPTPPLPDPYKQMEKEAPLIIAEVMPRFPACEDQDLDRQEKYACANQELLKYISDNLKYPRLARENGIQGMVVVRFVVEKDSSISNIEVVRDIGGGCGKEAVRVLKTMPRWVPGSQQGHPVRVQFNLPFRFRLQ